MEKEALLKATTELLASAWPSTMAALCVWREARGEPYEVKRAVASVIFNRQTDKRWPNELDEVILQPLQFSAFNKDDPNATLFPKRSRTADWRAFEECCKAVMEVRLDGPTTVATHYFDASIETPSWAHKMKYVGKLGKMTFYKE